MNDKLREALETIRSIAEWMNLSVQCVQNHPEEPPDYASEFDYKMAQASSELFNAIEIFDAQALAASKQEPQSTMVDKQSTKPEPQAQAGPEVVALMEKARLWVAAVSENLPLPEMRKAMEGLETALNKTLQSHREAMAPLEADRQKLRSIEAAMKIKGGDEHYPTEWAYLQACKVIDSQKEAIAKKDAALKACVEALQKSEPYRTCHEEAHEAAITQAQEAMR